MKQWLLFLKTFFTKQNDQISLPTINERSSLTKIINHWPRTGEFLKQRYQINLSEHQMQQSLNAFVRDNSLASPQIVFMEIQLFHQSKAFHSIAPKEAAKNLESFLVLDVREPWERKLGSIPGAAALDQKLFEKLKLETTKDNPMLLYCHFGIRSEDAGSQLSAMGFKNIYVLKGGIDAWSCDVDASIPRYENSWC